MLHNFLVVFFPRVTATIFIFCNFQFSNFFSPFLSLTFGNLLFCGRILGRAIDKFLFFSKILEEEKHKKKTFGEGLSPSPLLTVSAKTANCEPKTGKKEKKKLICPFVVIYLNLLNTISLQSLLL